MNPTGISLFYGSFDAETCIAEIRPPRGTYTVIARFHIIRPLRLLDFRKLTEAFEPVSHFHPQYIAKRDRDTFLKAFGIEISIPVHPQEENLGYLPTQAVAEYLAQRTDLNLDGIVFASTQSGNEGVNIVLFQRAARVEPLTHSFESEWYQPFEDFPEITVTATPLPASEPPSPQARTAEMTSVFDLAQQTLFDEQAEPPPAPPPATLRLDASGFQIKLIGAIRYAHVGVKFTHTTAEKPTPQSGSVTDDGLPF